MIAYPVCNHNKSIIWIFIFCYICQRNVCILIYNIILLELERRVSVDCVVTIDHIEYEVDYRFTKQRIRLRYSPDMESIYVVEADGTLTPIRLFNKIENADIKREKPRLYGGDD